MASLWTFICGAKGQSSTVDDNILYALDSAKNLLQSVLQIMNAHNRFEKKPPDDMRFISIYNSGINISLIIQAKSKTSEEEDEDNDESQPNKRSRKSYQHSFPFTAGIESASTQLNNSSTSSNVFGGMQMPLTENNLKCFIRQLQT